MDGSNVPQAAVSGRSKVPFYSITSSARASIEAIRDYGDGAMGYRDVGVGVGTNKVQGSLSTVGCDNVPGSGEQW